MVYCPTILNLCMANFLIHGWPLWHEAQENWVIPHIVLTLLSYGKSFSKNNWTLAFKNLKQFTASALRFLCIETDPSFSKTSLKDDFLSLLIKRRHLSWRRFILLLLVRFWHPKNYRKSPTRCKQDFNLCKVWIQALLNEDVHSSYNH